MILINFYNRVVIYSSRTNSIELVNFLFDTRKNFYITDETVYKSLTILGDFDDTLFLDWLFDKYSGKIVNIDKKNLSDILHNAQHCCILDWLIGKCRNKIVNLDSTTIGDILANIKHCNVLNWWFSKCQTSVRAISFNDQILNNVYTNADCQMLDFWYNKYTDCVLCMFFSDSILNSIFTHSVGIKNIEKMNWCLDKHVKKQFCIDFSSTKLNHFLLTCKNNNDIQFLEWIFDKHNKHIFNLTIFSNTINELIDRAVINNSDNLLNWIFDIHRVGAEKFNFKDKYLNNVILHKANEWIDKFNKMHKNYEKQYRIHDSNNICSSIKTYIKNNRL